MAQDGQILEVMHTSGPVFRLGAIFESAKLTCKMCRKIAKIGRKFEGQKQGLQAGFFDLCAYNADELDLFVA